MRRRSVSRLGVTGRAACADPGAAGGEQGCGKLSDPVGRLAEVLRAGEDGQCHEREDRRATVPDPAWVTRVGDLREQVEQGGDVRQVDIGAVAAGSGDAGVGGCHERPCLVAMMA